MKQFGKALSKIETPVQREGYIGPISSIKSIDKINVNNLSGAQVVDLKPIAPYGISSCPKTGMEAQVQINNNNNNTILGVYDPNKPVVEPGELILYSIGEASIYLTKDGKINIVGDVYMNGQLISSKTPN